MTEDTDPTGGRIVVGVDGTATSPPAVGWAVREALLRGASLHLIFVRRRYQRAPYSGMAEDPLLGEDDAAGNALLAAARQQASQSLPARQLVTELADGSPAKVLIGRSAGADLLVLGSAYPPGRPVNEGTPVIGAVARACLQSAACPVVIVATSS